MELMALLAERHIEGACFLSSLGLLIQGNNSPVLVSHLSVSCHNRSLTARPHWEPGVTQLSPDRLCFIHGSVTMVIATGHPNVSVRLRERMRQCEEC